MRMNITWLIVVLSTLLHLHQSAFAQTFCSVTCSKTSCGVNDTTTSGCTACNTGWSLSAGVCTPNSTNNYNLFNKTNDLGGNLTVSISTTVTCSGNYGGIGYSVYGWINTGITNTISVSSAGITKPLYFLIVYFGILSVDACSGGCGGKNYWSNSGYFFLDFVAADGFSQSNNYLRTGTTRVASGDYCFTSLSERWNKITQSYAYNISNSSLSWTIYNN